MAIIYNGVDKNKIENIIKSDEFCVFRIEMEEKLNIQDIQYEIEVQDFAYDGGYVDGYVNARTKFSNGYSKIDKVVLFIENIKNEVNRKFERLSIYEPIFNKAIETYIKVMFLHELIHIQQFKNNKLTKSVIEKEKELQYENRPLEIEAKNISKELIGEYGRFEFEIVKFINSNLSVNNNDVTKIVELFSNVTGSDNYDK